MARKEVKTTEVICIKSKSGHIIEHLYLNHYSSVLPCMPSLHRNARKSWHGALTDEDMERLMECKRMSIDNLKRLYPLKTAGSGNLLLEAVCMALCGIQDVPAVLKGYLRTALNDDDSYKTRWQKKRQKRNVPSSEVEMDDEWLTVLRCIDSCSGLYEDIHVFVLAHVLRRPIIVFSEEEEEELDGIYLPLNQKPDDCDKSPIVLAYSRYFVPLVSMDHAEDDAALSGVPLVVPGSTQPVIQFLHPEEEREAFALLQKYMDVTCAPTDDGVWIPVAKLHPIQFDPEYDLQSDKLFQSPDEESMKKTTLEIVSGEVEMCNPEPRRQSQATPSQLPNEIDDVDDCSYPRCDKSAPEPWWPFCYDHSPDSGLAPGGLLHSHTKWKEETEVVKVQDNIDNNKVQNRYEADDEDNCSYPGCDQTAPESWSPFCYEHSPDSGLAPGALLHSHEQYIREQDNTDEITVENSETDQDRCSYPKCTQHAPEPWWPFCYEHSPDSGLAPGGLLHSHNQWKKHTIPT